MVEYGVMFLAEAGASLEFDFFPVQSSSVPPASFDRQRLAPPVFLPLA